MLRKLLLSCLSISIAFICIEILLRIFHPYPDPYIRVKLSLTQGIILPESWQEIPGRRYTVTQNNAFDGDPSTAVIEINNQGYRGDVILPEHCKSDILRILCIGSSTTFCELQKEPFTWPSLVKKELKEKLSQEVLVSNAGVRGSTVKRFLLPLVQMGPEIKPQYVVCLAGMTDIDRYLTEGKIPTDPLVTLNQASHFKTFGLSLKVFLSEFQCYRLMRTFINNERNKSTSNSLFENLLNKRDNPDVPPIDTTHYRDLLRTFCKTCSGFNAKPVFITQPSIFLSSLPDDEIYKQCWNFAGTDKRWSRATMVKFLEAYNNTIIEVAKEEHGLVVDAAKRFKNDNSEFKDDCHFTDVGCKDLSLLISETILNDLSAIKTEPNNPKKSR
jgi:hypothetical protein